MSDTATRRRIRETSPASGPSRVAGPQPQLPAVAQGYSDLIRVFTARRRALHLPQLALDDLAGLQSGYTGKLECGDKNLGAMSLPAIAGALKLRLIVEPAPDALPGEILRQLPLLGHDAFAFSENPA